MKVRLSLPDEGLIIENIHDPTQSWMYKASDLLYVWHDPYYLNIIIVITLNRSHYRATGLYSASIFRLRGNDSVELFFQRVQQFFSQPSRSRTTDNNSKIRVRQSTPVDYRITGNNRKGYKSRHRSPTTTQLNCNPTPSSQSIPVHLITRTEFDPDRKLVTNLNLTPRSHQIHSETTISSDAGTSKSIKLDNNQHEDDEITHLNGHLLSKFVAELVHELKELRNEIATLKLEGTFTPVSAASASPLLSFVENKKEHTSLPSPSRNLMSYSGMDGEMQTDFSLICNEQNDLTKDNNTTINKSKEDLMNNKRKSRELNTTDEKKMLVSDLDNIQSDKEGKLLLLWS